MKEVEIVKLYDLNETKAAPLLESKTYPWEVLPLIKDFILELGKTLSEEEFEKRGEDVWIHKTAKIYPTANIYGPCIIDAETEVRPGAFIRGNALVGKKCVVGNSTELKNYVGDSVLGYKAHMGAGSITSNVKSDKTLVVVKGDKNYETGLKKFGAMLGDRVEVGCNSVLNPGTVIGRDSNVYPTSCVRGVIPENSIYKDKDNIVLKVSPGVSGNIPKNFSI